MFAQVPALGEADRAGAALGAGRLFTAGQLLVLDVNPERLARRPAAGELTALEPAGLQDFRRVDAVKVDLLAVDLDGVAVDHLGLAGDLGVGREGREKNEEGNGKSPQHGRHFDIIRSKHKGAAGAAAAVIRR